ncbi:CoA-transferase [Gordonia sp. FQ]|uniref:CoA-transferase n=1 Tax=Gordonia sp. FQ TaxID=3446634 RepID=UPI003F84EC54
MSRAGQVDVYDGIRLQFGRTGRTLTGVRPDELTVIGNSDRGPAAPIQARRVQRVTCSFPRQQDSRQFDAAFHAGETEVEIVPRGNLAGRIPGDGAGLGVFFTGFGTLLAPGQEDPADRRRRRPRSDRWPRRGDCSVRQRLRELAAPLDVPPIDHTAGHRTP